MKKNVLEFLEETAVSYPDRCVYSDPERTYTFTEAVRTARAIGSRIGSLKASGRPVAVFMEKSASMAVAILGVLYGGCCYCPIDTSMPEQRIRTILSVLDPVAMVTEQDSRYLAEHFDLKCPVWDFDELSGMPEDTELLARIRNGLSEMDPLYILFTSGSTGVPKGVAGCHRMILNNLCWLEKEFPYEPEDVLGSQVPFHFVISLHDIFVPLRFGCSTFVIPQEYFSSPARLVNCLNSNRITSIFWVPSALTVVSRLNGFDTQLPAFLRYIFFIGEVMPVRYLNYWRRYLPDARYVNMYGSTETHVSMFFELCRDFADDERLPIGRACGNVKAVILDDGGRPVEPGEETEGELYIGGAALSLGYYKDPEKTKDRFICLKTASSEQERFYRTGDIASYDSDGNIVYHGRKDFQIKRMGYRIELGEIEAAAALIPEISECVCVYDEDRQMILMLYTAAEKIDSKTVSSGISTRIPRYMMPNRYIYLEQMPKNANGKADRRGLKELYARSGNRQT